MRHATLRRVPACVVVPERCATGHLAPSVALEFALMAAEPTVDAGAQGDLMLADPCHDSAREEIRQEHRERTVRDEAWLAA